jgi:hypothetical protein
MATTAITVMGPIIAMDRASASALAAVAGIFMVAIIAELPIVAEDPCAVLAKGLRNTFGRAVSTLEAAPFHRLEICGPRPSTRTLLLLTEYFPAKSNWHKARTMHAAPPASSAIEVMELVGEQISPSPSFASR